MLNENTTLNENNRPSVGCTGEKPYRDLQEVCRKLDIVIQLLENLQVNLNINGDGCVVTLPDNGKMRVNR